MPDGWEWRLGDKVQTKNIKENCISNRILKFNAGQGDKQPSQAVITNQAKLFTLKYIAILLTRQIKYVNKCTLLLSLIHI